jgi:hypothetical protein
MTSPYTATNVCTYAAAGTYTAKVIVEQGTASPAQAQQTITVTSGGQGGNPTSPFQITGATVSNLEGRSAGVTVTTNEPASIRIQYGPTTAYGKTTIASPELTTIYENLTGLRRGTTYNFMVDAVPQGSTTTIQSVNYTFKANGH